MVNELETNLKPQSLLSFPDAENHRKQFCVTHIYGLLECSSFQKLRFVVKANHSSIWLEFFVILNVNV